MSDLFAHLTGWASIVGDAGLVLALIQLGRTRKSVKAIADTEKTLAKNQVLVLLPQLQRVEPDLDLAVQAGSRELVLRYLADWRRLAADLRGLIREQPYADVEGLAQLGTSILSAATAKADLLAGNAELVNQTAAVRRDIALAVEYIGTLSSALRSYSAGEGEN